MSFTKKVPKDDKKLGYLYKEALVHKLCNMSPFLPKTTSVTIKDDQLTIKMEKLEKKLKEPTTDNKIKAWKNVLQAVALLNYFGIAHRDIKTDNIMFRNGEEAVLIDFGLSKPLLGGFHTPSVVSDFYRAPELIKELDIQKYSFEIDSWALGIWGLELWNTNFDHEKFITEWKKGNILYIENIPQKLQPIISSFLKPAEERKTALDWVNINSGKKLFIYPKDFKCDVPISVFEWEIAYKSIYWALSNLYKDHLEAMTLWALSLLVLPFEFELSDLSKQYKVPEAIIQGRVLDWFINWKIGKTKE